MGVVGRLAGPVWPAFRAAVAYSCGTQQRAPDDVDPDLDWGMFSDLVDRHRVGPLVHSSRWADHAGAPPPVRERLAQESERAVLRSLRLLAAQRAATRALNAAGIDTLVLKGAPLAQEAYGSLAARHQGDLDLLIAPDRATAAVVALCDAGFRWRAIDLPESMHPPDGGRAALLDAPSLVLVKEAILDYGEIETDLHWRLTANPRLMPVDARWLRAPRMVIVGGVSSPVLPPLPEWWYLMAHGTTHRWRRLKWLADIPRLAASRPELLSPEALAATERAGLERCVACGLRVAEQVLAMPLPDPARRWTASVSWVAPLVRRSLAAIARSTAIPEQITPASLPGHIAAQMSLRRDRAYRAAEAQALLLDAGRLQLEPNPRLATLASGPMRWMARQTGFGAS